MYYLYTVWPGCSHEIFSMVSFSIYILCIFGYFSQIDVLNFMNECFPKLILPTQLLLNFIKRKTSKWSFRLNKKKLYGKYFEPYKYNNPFQGRVNVRLLCV